MPISIYIRIKCNIEINPFIIINKLDSHRPNHCEPSNQFKWYISVTLDTIS